MSELLETEYQEEVLVTSKNMFKVCIISLLIFSHNIKFLKVKTILHVTLLPDELLQCKTLDFFIITL